MNAPAASRRLRLVATGGEGPPLVLIHGFASDRLSWLANQPALQGVRRVYSLDLPGHGAETLAERSLGEIAALVAATLDGEGLEACDLVGHSLGATLCLLLARDRPDLVRSLVLLAPAGLGTGIDADFLDRFPRLASPDETEALLSRLVSRPRLVNRQMIAHVLAQLGRPGSRQALTSVAAMIVEEAGEIARAVAGIRAGTLPRLTVWGDADRINPLDRAALEAFGGEVEIVPQAGHLPHVESAVDVNGRILSFLAGRGR